jgi:hypothetical protein
MVRIMTDTPDLRPATRDEIAQTLSSALMYEGRRRVHHADTFMAEITADRLVKHLEQAGFVLMKKPPGRVHSTSNIPMA